VSGGFAVVTGAGSAAVRQAGGRSRHVTLVARLRSRTKDQLEEKPMRDVLA